MLRWKRWFWNLNKYILFLFFSLQLIGLFLIIKLSAVLGERFSQNQELFFVIKHFITMVLSVMLFTIFSVIPWGYTTTVNKILYYVSLALTVVTVFIGTNINGVRRWIHVAGFTLQASELLKIFTILQISDALAKNQHKYSIMYLTLSTVACLVQPDLGMTFLITTTSVCQIIINNKNIKTYVIIFGSILVGGIISMTFLATYAFDRFLIFFGKKNGFQIQQSLLALSKSNLLGAGKYVYIPDSHCDFAFSAAVNTMGILFGILIIIGPMIFLSVLWPKIQKEQNQTKKLFIVGVLAQFSIQTYFHILSNVGTLPTKGVTLPLISYGGSSMISWGIIFGIVINYAVKRAGKI